MIWFFTQVDSSRVTLNTYAIVGIYLLLIVIAAYVSNVIGRVRGLFGKNMVQNYITTEAKLKSIELNINGIINCNHEGRILTWNKGASKIFGYDEFAVVGKCLSIILPD